MIGYKVGKVENKYVLVTLEIPEDAITNVIKEDEDSMWSHILSYRTNKAKVIKIEDVNGNEFGEAKSAFYTQSTLTYYLNQILEIDDYDSDKHVFVTRGIHFFLTPKVSNLYVKESKPSITFECFYENNIKCFSCPFLNGELNGDIKYWYSNGMLFLKKTFKNGVADGYCYFYKPDGDLIIKREYKNNKRVEVIEKKTLSENNKKVEVIEKKTLSENNKDVHENSTEIITCCTVM